MAIKEGHRQAEGLKFAILVSRFNEFVTERLLAGALETFARQGGHADDVDVVRVPGAFEMPLTAHKLARSGRYDGVVALGAVIRGETPHFDYVSAAATEGLAWVARETGIPIGFGVLTTDTVDQALARSDSDAVAQAGAKGGHKGVEAVLTTIVMVNLLQELGKP